MQGLRRGPLATFALAIVVLATTAPAAAAAREAGREGARVNRSFAQVRTPYRLDLADRNDFVPQANFVQCVGASMQMMLNIMGASDRTARTQLRLQTLARSLSGPTREGFERKGASVHGWTEALNALDVGRYRLVGTDSIQEAMRLAASSIRATGRPVGLLVWAGRHAWVMSGFQATADPRFTSEFRVTKAIVLDPLYPHGSSRWGPSPAPREAVSIATLGRQFVPRRRGAWAGALPGAAGLTMRALAGKYVIVMPYEPVAVARANRFVAS
jgi:hypothetical protein